MALSSLISPVRTSLVFSYSFSVKRCHTQKLTQVTHVTHRLSPDTQMVVHGRNRINVSCAGCVAHRAYNLARYLNVKDCFVNGEKNSCLRSGVRNKCGNCVASVAGSYLTAFFSFSPSFVNFPVKGVGVW